MTKDIKSQLSFQWPGESKEEMKAANYAAIERSIHEDYPMTPEEAAALPPGARLARFVPLAECESCNFSTYDHTQQWKYPMSVCLKDLFQLGLWSPDSEV